MPTDISKQVPSNNERPKPDPSLSIGVPEILGPEGRLAVSWPDYEHRPGQLKMAEEAARAFRDEDIAVVEAGTGTGKTLAYIIPAILSGYKTVVSTGTKNLQEQIFFKDIPFIHKTLGSGFRAAYLKGRENYLCLYFYKRFLQQPTFAVATEAFFLDALADWAQKTKTGDRAELKELPESFTAWSDITATRERCLGRKCPDFEDCFLWRARRWAASADLVVVNHHLFMADLAVREGGHGEVIPGFESVVFDEAHQLEDVATQYFGVEVSSWRLARLRRDVEGALGRLKKINPALSRSLITLGHHADTLARNFFTRDGEFELWTRDDPELDRLREFGSQVLAGLGSLAAHLEKIEDKDEEFEGLVERVGQVGSDLAFLMEGADSGFVYYAERRGRGLFLRASPIDVASILREKLLDRGRPLVFTSATLTAKNSFQFFKDRIGLRPEVEGLMVESPFDMENQSVLYVPRSFPQPNSDQYLPSLTEEIERLLRLSRGRAFVLFTSYRNLNHVADRLAGRLPWKCLVQGEAPRNALLDQFREDISSVLLATHSFWQGVDVPGESLSAVIIDKLPFPRPDRPLIKARSERMREEGRNPFFDYFVPEAIITLKQGLGRLIRTKSDRGLMAVLDSRLVQKGYGRTFIVSLPHLRVTHNIEDVGAFFGSPGDVTG